MEAFEKPAKTLSGNNSLDQDAKTLNEGSKGDAFKVKKSWENGVRVSMNGKESSCLDEDGEGLEDSELNGVSSLLQMKESVRNIDVNGGRDESGKGFGTLLGAVDKSKEAVVENLLPNGDDDDDDDDGSLVDNHGESARSDDKERREFDEKENGGKMVTGRVNEIDDDGGDDLGCEFSAGSFVWGKIRSHPWWPGQVYNLMDASDHAVKVRQRGRLLVAYFGDRSFAWCHPSQLRSFDENFEEMSKLSCSKNFVNAVQASIDEIGRLVESKMTCSCVSREHCIGLDRPLAANAGIKKGVLVPEGGIGKLPIGLFEPEEILVKLKQISQDVTMSNLLECTLLKGWLSAFNRSIGCYQMPMYHEPLSIPDLEENVRTLVVDMSDYSEAVEVPITGPVEEDWVPSSGSKFGQRSQTLLRCPEILEDAMYHRRKQKSIAEILKGELDVLQTRKGEGVAQNGMKSGEQTSSSRRKKAKGNNKADGDNDSDSSFIPRKRKGSKLSGSLTARKDKMYIAETDVFGANEEMHQGYSLRGRKKKSKGTTDDNGDTEVEEDINNRPVSAEMKVKEDSGIGKIDVRTKELIQSGSLLRERKKSKYLSPPYTSSTGKLRTVDVEAESLEVSNDTQFGEQITKAAGNLVSGEEVDAEQEASNESSLLTPKQYLSRMIDPAKAKTPANEVLFEVRSIALRPQYQWKNNSFDIVVEFLSVFRNSVYRDGSNYKMYNQCQPHRKRKSPDFLTGSLGKDRSQAGHVSSGDRSHRKKVGKNEETTTDQSEPGHATRASSKKANEESKAYNPKTKQAARAAVMKKQSDKQVALFVTFGPGSSLPTKDDLIRIYSQFGALDTEDTDMFYSSFCARVVFLRSFDAEQALTSSQNDSPFGASNVSFRLRLHPAASAHKHREKPSAKPSLSKEGPKRSTKPLASQNSHLDYIRQKLEMLTSMLEKSDENMSSNTKSKLQSEMKGLLKEVNTMVESAS